MSDSEMTENIFDAFCDYGCKYSIRVTWGVGDVIEGSQPFESEESARGMLLHDTDLTDAEITTLFQCGENVDNWSQQWIRVSRPSLETCSHGVIDATCTVCWPSGNIARS
jgi:hypothetical protein